MHIDLNADLGESFGAWRMGEDAAMLEVVSSANVACGFHAGDPVTMRATCLAAVASGVRIGAHVGYRDLLGFGRRAIDVAPEEVHAETVAQIGALDALARSVGGHVAYVKPHGALYHAATADPSIADAVAAGASECGGLDVVGFPGSELLASAERAGLRAVSEWFADRGYSPDGNLLPRGTEGAVLSDPDEVARRAVDAARSATADTICLHGDTPGAVTMARAVRAALSEAGCAIRSWQG